MRPLVTDELITQVTAALAETYADTDEPVPNPIEVIHTALAFLASDTRDTARQHEYCVAGPDTCLAQAVVLRWVADWLTEAARAKEEAS